MIELPDKKKCYNLPEQVAQNLRNITFLAEQYKNIDALPAVWQVYKEEFDSEMETFEGWERTFGGWETTLETYLANMSSAAVGAIAGQNIAPNNVAVGGNLSVVGNVTGNVNFSGDVTAQTLKQTQTNYSKAFSVLSPQTYITMEDVYSRFEEINNLVAIVLTAKASVNDGGSHSISTLSYNQIELDTAHASKIIDINGKSVAEAGGNGALIAVVPVIVMVDGNAKQAYLELANLNSVNYMSCTIRTVSNTDLTGSSEYLISARTFLTML